MKNEEWRMENEEWRMKNGDQEKERAELVTIFLFFFCCVDTE